MDDRVDLTDVEAKAQAATEGPWEPQESTHGTWEVRDAADRVAWVPAIFSTDPKGHRPDRTADAAHIATADPPTVLAMAEALRIAREALESLRPSIHPQDAVTMKAEAALARMDALVDFGGES